MNLVPLLEILSESLDSGVGTQTVMSMYEKLLNDLGTEHEILLRTDLKKIKEIGGDRVSEGIEKVRNRKIHIEPGYDNTYGIVEIWSKTQKESSLPQEKDKKDSAQLGLEF